MIELLLIVVALLMVVACGIFVAAEFSLVTIDRSKIEKAASKGDAGAKGVLHALQTLSTQLSGAQIGITITNLAIGFLAEPAVAYFLRGPLEQIGLEGTQVSAVAILLGITIATVVTMIFGELVPKNLAISRPLQTAKAVQLPQRLFTRLMYYPIQLTNGTANRILRKFFSIEPQEELASARSVEELLSVVKHSAKRGTIEKDTAVLLERSLEFSERNALDVMTPRVKLETVMRDDYVLSVIEAVNSSGYSRFPVIHQTIDNIVGIVHVKDAVSVPFEDRKNVTIAQIMEPAVFIPSSIELDSLIHKMRDEKIESVITIDEFGGVDGILTLEDLVEELVGEVKDEHDEHGVAIRKIRKNVWSVSGLLRSDEVGQETDLFLPEEEEFETIGGLVLDRFEEVPNVGDSVEIEALDRRGRSRDAVLTVQQMDGRRIDRIELRLKSIRRDQ